MNRTQHPDRSRATGDSSAPVLHDAIVRVKASASLRSRGARHGRATFACCLLFFALSLAACGEKSLVKVSTESEAIEIVTVLQKSEVSAEKLETGDSSAPQWNIVVAGSQYELANQLLRYYDLPRVEEQAKESGLLSYDEERHARQLKESKKDIEQHLRKLNGVARVSITLSPPQDDTRMNPYPAKADVLITQKEAQLSITREDIQQSVASSFPTLKAENVNVTLQYEPPPSRAKRESGRDPRTYAIFAVGLVAVALLVGLLLFLWRKARRQRLALKATSTTIEEETEEEVDDERKMLTPTVGSSAS